LKTFFAFGVYGTSALTAVTAQNTMGVTAVHAIPADVVRAQIDAVTSDLPPTAVKTGMLATRELVGTVADALGEGRGGRYVLDPVMVATRGARLLEADAESAVRDRLVPLADVVTPNLREAEILTGRAIEDLDGMRRAARALVDMGAASALVKGGHLEGEAVDLFWDGVREHVWRKPRLDTPHTHGTGCTLSAAICAGLARGDELAAAARLAVAWVHVAIATAPGLGGGHGPVNHFAPVGRKASGRS
ncbi:MAG TPA: bifunctional hydroxymethylpyrimidine kinase/phosphomethylpyrimidine kinase, partial [Longimicrobiales bacterium]|nr:bifunctional hydroxymethylpyrimidine kinase/phosphomethylpyrimidine kinase [Longimicrobiales bacterium]